LHGGDWFFGKSTHILAGKFCQRFGVAVPGCQNHSYILVDEPKLTIRFLAAHPGHLEIEENRSDFVASLLIDRNALCPILRQDHGVAVEFE
jgi:hypothetical protein